MNEFYSYQELPYGNKVEVINIDDFMIDYRVPGDVITVDETWLQDKLKENLKLQYEKEQLQKKLQEYERAFKLTKSKIQSLETCVEVLKTHRRTKFLNTRIF